MSEENWDKSADKYYDDVISPIKNSVDDLLYDELKKHKGKIVDLGCGVGEIIPFLSKNFEEVHAWDYSKKMITIAKKNNHELKNVTFEKKDFLKISEKEKFDTALSINSLLNPNPKKINTMLKKFYELLKKNGKLICVLPAIESYVYQEMLASEKNDYQQFTPSQIDFFKGTIILGNEEQKVFYKFEAKHRLEKTGFKNIEINKIRYNWKDWLEAGQRYHPNEKEPWDWLITCEK